MPEGPRDQPASLPKEASQQSVYLSLLSEIQHDPHSENVWTKTVTLARAEEGVQGVAPSFYTRVPLEELITIGQRLREISSRDQQYVVLTERASTGERWYDIVLGHVNDKAFAPVADEMSYLRALQGEDWEQGLDVGSGTGNTLRAMAPFAKRIIGIDKLVSVLRRIEGEEDFPQNAQVREGNATALPVDTESIEVSASNGLTSYLTREQMQRYVGEIARVLKRGGWHFEPFVMKEKEDPLPGTEMEYLTSAKALLVCFIDNLVSQSDAASDWRLRDMIDAFEALGFEYYLSEPNQDGAWFAAFCKQT